MSTGVRVKICGLKRPEEAEACARAGADYIGVVFAERLRRVTPETARRVAAAAGPARLVGVFVDAAVEEILANREIAGLHVAQLHGDESPETCRRLRREGLEVWKAIRPRAREQARVGWARFAGSADAILLEGFSPAAAGGTGTTFPYAWLSDLDRDGTDLVLAGGLDPANVARAIDTVQPDIVDVSSGVESAPGLKSASMIAAFVSAARGGLAREESNIGGTG